MANHSHSTVTFQWEPYTDSYIIEVEPPFGELGKSLAISPALVGPPFGELGKSLAISPALVGLFSYR